MSVLPYRLRKLVAVRPGVKTYQGTDLADDTPVLIHHIHPGADAVEREERFERFADIAERLARIRHPALPNVRFWTPRPEDPLYVVSDLPYGTPLDLLLDRGGPLPWETAVALLRPVVEALSEAHAEGVVHLGLRPDRILLRPEAPPLLVDLGFTPLLLGDVPRPVPITDPLWRALYPRPELVAPELLTAEVGDRRTDVHGVGLLLFHMTTLAWPYSSGTSVLVYNQVRVGVRASFLTAALGHAPEALQELVRRATARDPADRYPDTRALQSAFDALPVPGRDREERLAALSALADETPWTARFGEILTVVDGGRGRPLPDADETAADEEAPAAPELDEDRAAALEAERDRQIRLAELTLERMRSTRRPDRRRRVVGWIVAALFVVALAFLLPRLIDRGSRSVPVYEGGVDPSTGLTHGGPPSSADLHPTIESLTPRSRTPRDLTQRPPVTSRARGTGRRPAVLLPSERPRQPLER